jgi:hypothetical protein
LGSDMEDDKNVSYGKGRKEMKKPGSACPVFSNIKSTAYYFFITLLVKIFPL